LVLLAIFLISSSGIIDSNCIMDIFWVSDFILLKESWNKDRRNKSGYNTDWMIVTNNDL